MKRTYMVCENCRSSKRCTNKKYFTWCTEWRHRRWHLVVILIAIVAVLVLAACLVWATIDPAHNPPKRDEVPVYYTDFVLKEDEGYSFSRVMDGIIYLDAAGLKIKNVTVWGIGSDGTVYAAQNDKPVMWFGGMK